MTIVRTATAAIALGLALTGCNTLDRLSSVGQAPDLSEIRNPTAQPGYVPVQLPMPAPQYSTQEPNSLWRAGSRAFFKDQRASRVGDILTVLIDVDDKADMSNESLRSRDNSENAGLTSFLGYESKLSKVLPDAVDPTKLIDGSSKSSSDGKGKIARDEKIKLQVAALVSQILPNGNLVIQGRQEMRVNYEVRDLQIMGVIRPEDITSQNTISYEKIAEARISYGGRGQITDVQQPRYGQQLYDILFPF